MCVNSLFLRMCIRVFLWVLVYRCILCVYGRGFMGMSIYVDIRGYFFEDVWVYFGEYEYMCRRL